MVRRSGSKTSGLRARAGGQAAPRGGCSVLQVVVSLFHSQSWLGDPPKSRITDPSEARPCQARGPGQSVGNWAGVRSIQTFPLLSQSHRSLVAPVSPSPPYITL